MCLSRIVIFVWTLTFVSSQYTKGAKEEVETYARGIIFAGEEHTKGIFFEDEVLLDEQQSRAHDRLLFVSPPKPRETALVIRILGVDKANKTVNTLLNEEALHDRAFGVDFSAATQFSACSGGEYEFVPFQHKALSLDGVITVTVDEQVYTTSTRTFMLSTAESKLCNLLDLPTNCSIGVDRKLYVMPGGLPDESALGFAYGGVGDDLSLYGDASTFRIPSFAIETILHEIAHGWRVSFILLPC